MKQKVRMVQSRRMSEERIIEDSTYCAHYIKSAHVNSNSQVLRPLQRRNECRNRAVKRLRVVSGREDMKGTTYMDS